MRTAASTAITLHPLDGDSVRVRANVVNTNPMGRMADAPASAGIARRAKRQRYRAKLLALSTLAVPATTTRSPERFSGPPGAPLRLGGPMGSECTCASIGFPSSVPCAYCRRSAAWEPSYAVNSLVVELDPRDAEIAALKAELTKVGTSAANLECDLKACQEGLRVAVKMGDELRAEVDRLRLPADVVETIHECLMGRGRFSHIAQLAHGISARRGEVLAALNHAYPTEESNDADE